MGIEIKNIISVQEEPRAAVLERQAEFYAKRRGLMEALRERQLDCYSSVYHVPMSVWDVLIREGKRLECEIDKVKRTGGSWKVRKELIIFEMLHLPWPPANL